MCIYIPLVSQHTQKKAFYFNYFWLCIYRSLSDVLTCTEEGILFPPLIPFPKETNVPNDARVLAPTLGVLVSTWLFPPNCRQFRGMCVTHTHTNNSYRHDSFSHRHDSFSQIAANSEVCVHVHAHTIRSGTDMTLSPRLPPIHRHVY